MTILQVAEALRIGRNTVYMLVNAKTLAHIQIGTLIRILKKYLIDYYENAVEASTQ